MSVTPQTSKKSEALVFINYRREDAGGYAGRLYERLSKHFGHEHIFMDVSAIKPGSDFVNTIKEEVTACESLLVLIGHEWLDCSADGCRRLDDSGDFVRIEISSALARKALVIPVLIEGADVPREKDLPNDLKPLARLQALALTNERWDYDTGRLIAALDEGLGERLGRSSLLGRLRSWRRGRIGVGRYWRLFPVRLLAGVLVLAAALAPQILLAYRPEPVVLGETGKFSPTTAKLGRETLTIEGPALDARRLLLTHAGKADEIVDLDFERARLDGETTMLFVEQNPPTLPSSVSYVTTKPAHGSSGEPCRTFIKVRAADQGRAPSALHFYQQQAAPGARTLELKTDGGVLLSVNTDMPAESGEHAPGCAKLLKVGPDFAEIVSGVSTIGVIAEANSAARFRFNPATEKDALWSGTEGFFQPFAFGNSIPAALRARAVEVRSLGRQDSGATSILSAHSVDGGEPLTVESLWVGSDRLHLNVSGLGFVKVNGEDYIDPFGRVRRHPITSVLLAMADVALLVWVVHLLFGKRRPALR